MASLVTAEIRPIKVISLSGPLAFKASDIFQTFNQTVRLNIDQPGSIRNCYQCGPGPPC